MGLLRLLLALSVVANHCGPILGENLVGGQIAVQSFYIISGFYMSLILNEKYIGANGSYKLFISNRFIRLYPIYWTVLIVTLLDFGMTAIITRGHSLPKFDTYLSVHTNFFSLGYLILTNLIIFGQDLVMFMGIDPETGRFFFTSDFTQTHPPLHSFLFIPQAWTLGLELMFYLVAPFIVRKGFKVVVPIIIISFGLRLFLYNFFHLQNDPWTYRFFPTEIMFFLLGYLAYRMYLFLKSRPIPKRFSQLVLFLCIAFTLVYPFLPPIKVPYFPFTLKESFYLAAITLSIPVLFNFLKKNRFDSAIGELSYPVYICHIIVLLVCGSVAGLMPAISFINTGNGIAVLTLVFAYLLNVIVAQPIEKYRQSRVVVNDKKVATV
jgi:peptidoglycan/LPS O-acetylase OafA/YrhL